MKTGMMVVITMVLIVAGAIPAVAKPPTKIEIDDGENKVMFQNFSIGDPWNITIWNASTNALAYKFNGTIGMNNTNISGNNWKVWFSCVSQGAMKHSVLRYLEPGNYSVYANGTHAGSIIWSGPAIVKINATYGEPVCLGQSPISPIPELSTVVLMSAGLLGLFGLARVRRRD